MSDHRLPRVAGAVIGVLERLDNVTLLREAMPLDLFMDDHHKGVWWNARRAWEHLSLSSADYVLLIQDDVRLCIDFRAAIPWMLSHLPGPSIVGLFCSGKNRMMVNAQEVKASWIEASEVWGQAIVMPRGWVQGMLEWLDKRIKESWPHDDNRVSLWASCTGHPMRITVPSLVDHLPDFKSTMGHAVSGSPIPCVGSGLAVNWHEPSFVAGRPLPRSKYQTALIDPEAFFREYPTA